MIDLSCRRSSCFTDRGRMATYRFIAINRSYRRTFLLRGSIFSRCCVIYRYRIDCLQLGKRLGEFSATRYTHQKSKLPSDATSPRKVLRPCTRTDCKSEMKSMRRCRQHSCMFMQAYACCIALQSCSSLHARWAAEACCTCSGLATACETHSLSHVWLSR